MHHILLCSEYAYSPIHIVLFMVTFKEIILMYSTISYYMLKLTQIMGTS